MPPKKKILFLCSNMNIGGFQRSLVSLLQCFDYEQYEVDLLLSNPVGILKPYIPKSVHILEPLISSSYYAPFPECVISLLKQMHPVQALYRILGAVVSLFDKGKGFIIANKAIPKLVKQYDVAIDYNGQQLLYYMVNYVNAQKKITFFHSDYKKWPYYQKTDRRYYKEVDAIVTVSDECVSSMKEIFPEYSEKIIRIENIISAKTVQVTDDTQYFEDGFQGIRLLTVGRVCYDKGLDLAIEACKILRDKEYEFRWYWVGPYEENDQLVIKIRKEKLEDTLVLLGATNNPYGYMRQADILVHPSRFEGKSVTVEEAKVLHLPIVATDYSTVHNQIEDGKTGIITEINAEAIASGVAGLIDVPEKRMEIKQYMQNHCIGNEDEVHILYELIEV